MPYNAQANAQAEITRALAAGKHAHLPTVLIFGANWCGSCRSLDKSMLTDRNAALIASRFNVVKIDVGNWDHNMDIVDAFDNPIDKGIPAAVVIEPSGQTFDTMDTEALDKANEAGDEAIYLFFSKIASDFQAQGGAGSARPD